MTRWVSRIITANVLVFLLTETHPELRSLLAFNRYTLLVQPWTPLTYMFVHAGFGHIFFNMLVLYFFGQRVEDRLGGRRFLTLYLLSGLGGAALSFVMDTASIVGASGATFGVSLAFAYFWPREKVLIWGVLPVEARVLVVATTAYTLYAGLRPGSGIGGGVAHFAHLGGYATAYLYLAWIERHSPAREFRKRVDTALYGGTARVIGGPPEPRWDAISREGLHPLNLEELDRLQAKAAEHGVASLTPDERAFVHRLSLRETGRGSPGGAASA